jgi:arsenate reductase
MSSGPIRVLFVCTGNSARSQLAEALLTVFGGPDFAAFSAGTDPHGVHRETVRVLDELCIDWSGARSKSVAEFLDQPFDYVITVCDRARQSCPMFPGRHETLHWDLADPAEVEGPDEVRLEAFRRTRADLTERLVAFIEVANSVPREDAVAG